MMLMPGKVRIVHKTLSNLYEALNERKDQPVVWEAGFRLAALLGRDAFGEPLADVIQRAVETQTEEGCFGGAPEEAAETALSLWAMYCLQPAAERLQRLMKWAGWLYRNGQIEQLARNESLSERLPDLAAMLEHLYRLSGHQALLKLLQRLRTACNDWSGLLNSDRILSGRYSAEELADAARLCLQLSLFSGNRVEEAACEAAWKRLAKSRGAACGGLVSLGESAGLNPASDVDTLDLCAWVEALCAVLQADAGANEWAAAELDRICWNALPMACLNGLHDCQSVNCPEAQSAGTPDTHLLVRAARAWIALQNGNIMQQADGTPLILRGSEGVYGVRIGDRSVRFTLQGSPVDFSVAMDMKESAAGGLQIRVPAWADSVRVMLDGRTLGTEQRDGSVRLRGTWQPGMTLHVSFTPKLLTAAGYRQSRTVHCGPWLMALPVQENNWRLALTGEPVLREGRVYIPVCSVREAWKSAGILPVLPAAEGETAECEMRRYAESPCRLAQLPWAQA